MHGTTVKKKKKSLNTFCKTFHMVIKKKVFMKLTSQI